MDFDFPTEDDPRRAAVRAWLAKNPKPTPRELLESGYEVPHWPAPYGLAADPEFQLIISQELERAGVKRNGNLLSASNLGPSLLTHGTPEAKERYLEKMLMGAERWAQMMSEPSAGSDLAALRTSAVRDGDYYVVNGQKNWSNGSHADVACVIVRTDPHAAKHAGLSVLIIDMKSPGISTRPIYNMNQDPTDFPYTFDETFFDNVRVPITNRIGQEGEGWRLTQQMLQTERMVILEHLVKPTARGMIAGLHQIGSLHDPALGDEAAKLYIEGEMIRLIAMRALSDKIGAKPPGPEASVQKLLAAPHGQKVLDLAKRVQGQAGLIEGEDVFPGANAQLGHNNWDDGFWENVTLTLRVGSHEVNKNIIGERLLGLPRDLDPSAKGDWSEHRKAGR